MFKVITALLVLLPQSITLAGGADSTGNGGDAIIKLFLDAREVAVRNLANVDACNLKDAHPDVRNWLLKNRFKIMEVVEKSEHVWVDKSANGKCATVFPNKINQIQFGIKDCKESIYREIDRAAWLLVHESVHQFKIESDVFSDAVATAVYNSTGQPNCQYDPFTVDACPADPIQSPVSATRVFKRGETYKEVVLGEYRLYSRTRLCSAPGECDFWEYKKGDERSFYTGEGRLVKVPATNKVSLIISDSTSEASIRTLASRGCGNYKKAVCDLGVGPGAANDLFEKIGPVVQKLTFLSVFNGTCLRQSANLIFKQPNGRRWIESQHVLVWQK